jgi:hypothetical protein
MNKAKLLPPLLQLAVCWRVGRRSLRVSSRKEITMFALRRLMMGTAIIEFIATAQYLPAHPPKPNDSKVLARGRYLGKIAGCNVCHTPGYTQMGG